MAPGTDELRTASGTTPGEGERVLTIAGLFDEVDAVLSAAFPRTRRLWVRGQVQKISDYHGRSGHCYLDLIDPETGGDRQAPVLSVKCWRNTWGPLRSLLRAEGIELAPGMVVALGGSLDFYRARGEVNFILAELDITALLGRLAAQRAELLRTLAAEGLLERNRALRVPAVPLRVGLVASPATEGYRDFLGQLTGSGFAFHLTTVPTTVQGAEAPTSIAAAIGALSALGPGTLDLVVLVRGGGSRADLAAFDTEPVARAVAASTVPVWTGIGHTGDESVADLVANRACITPTECGRELALRVGQWWEAAVAGPADLVCRRAGEAVAAAGDHQGDARRRLSANARHLIGRQDERLRAQASAVGRDAWRSLADAATVVAVRAARLGPLAVGHLDRSDDQVGAWRRLLSAYNVDRQLERGYTITLGPDGRLLRRAAAVSAGAVLTTRLADGTVRSVVTAVTAGRPSGPATGAPPTQTTATEERR